MRTARRISEPLPAGWAEELLPASALTPVPLRHDRVQLRSGSNGLFARLEASFENVRAMDILTFQQTVSESYRAVLDHLAAIETPHPIRLWVFIPGIHEELGPGLDRYMVFNAGRFSAYSTWYGGREALGQSLAAGSAVGVEGDRLVLHCLAAAERGAPVENPRQVPAYCYSRRYGPLPPCFARATRIGLTPWAKATLLVGGTASIRGEDSLHSGDLEAQILETFRNLASLVGSGCGTSDGGEADPLARDWLSRFRELRVYRPREDSADPILSAVEAHFPRVERVELLEAELCRPELLVEIEGLADIA